MGKFIITFGFNHKHHLKGVDLDHNCVGEFIALNRSEANTKAFKRFGSKWCFLYTKEEFMERQDLSFYPRGIVKIKSSDFED